MKNRNKLSARLVALLSAGILGLTAIPATAAPPVDSSGTLDFGPGELCDFAVRLVVTGKTKTIGPLLGDHKITSPGLKVTTTAVDSAGNAVGKSVRYVATGTLTYTKAVDPKSGQPYFEVKATGQNLLFSAELGGLFYVVGNTNFAVTLDLPDNQAEVRPFSGQAKPAVNICDPLS
ncbi:hypothetical protein [Arthrobacter oryzae]|uniref:hypothetical protein n=1 Tax=Arthrobacter oryzae TaxID=409290 RepID=UPI001C82B6C7|nr:hypothetical protein [Arthrobacter oryzae]